MTRARGARGAARPQSSEARVLGGEGAGRRKPAKARCGKAAARAQCSEDALAARARRRASTRLKNIENDWKQKRS